MRGDERVTRGGFTITTAIINPNNYFNDFHHVLGAFLFLFFCTSFNEECTTVCTSLRVPRMKVLLFRPACGN